MVGGQSALSKVNSVHLSLQHSGRDVCILLSEIVLIFSVLRRKRAVLLLDNIVSLMKKLYGRGKVVC